ncbi:MAG: hypothetical protein Q8N28_00355 [bacterium]|nr:hypothetical protein [bacterium]
MAIVIQEERKKINWFVLSAILLIAATIVGVIYYLFFVKPSLIEKVAPLKLQSIKEISSIKLDPGAVIDNPRFQILKQYAHPIEIGPVGKSNPFIR